jgi:hypothetical protein
VKRLLNCALIFGAFCLYADRPTVQSIVGSNAVIQISVGGSNVQVVSGNGVIDGVKGSGKLVSETVEVPDTINKVKVSGAAFCKVVEGNESKVTVTTDDNVLEHVRRDVDKDTLSLHLDSNCYNCTLRYLLVSRKLPESFKASGAVRLDINPSGKHHNKISIKSSGSSSVKVCKGKFRSFFAKVSGAAKVDASSVSADEVAIKTSGASRARIGQVNKRLIAKASGASSIKYANEPDFMKLNISGASTIGYW